MKSLLYLNCKICREIHFIVFLLSSSKQKMMQKSDAKLIIEMGQIL